MDSGHIASQVRAVLALVGNSDGVAKGRRELSMSESSSFDIRHHDSIASIPPGDWDRLFPGKSEDWAYFRACELSNSLQFKFSALAVYDGGELIAATPVFKLDLRIDMALGDSMRRFSDYLMRIAPRLVKLPIIGMGHPMTEECPLGFAPGLSHDARARVLAEMIRALEVVAKASRCKIVVMKDVTHDDTAAYRTVVENAGYGAIESLPIAQMNVSFTSLDAYIQSMPSKRRTQIRKKMRQAGEVDVSFVDNIDGLESELKALYNETRQRRARNYEAFDEVPDDYFSKVTASSDGNVKIMLSRIDGKLVGFMFLLVEDDRLIFKFVGMHYPLALDRSLYFHQWMSMVDFCIKNRITLLQAGQTNYTTKIRMGCELRRSWVFFKYTGRILGPVVKLIGSKQSLAAQEPDLIELGKHAHYLNEPRAE